MAQCHVQVSEKKAILTPFIESSFCVQNELIWRGDNTLLPPNKIRFNPKSGGKAILKATDSIIKITSETGNGYVCLFFIETSHCALT